MKIAQIQMRFHVILDLGSNFSVILQQIFSVMSHVVVGVTAAKGENVNVLTLKVYGFSNVILSPLGHCVLL